MIIKKIMNLKIKIVYFIPMRMIGKQKEIEGTQDPICVSVNVRA